MMSMGVGVVQLEEVQELRKEQQNERDEGHEQQPPGLELVTAPLANA